MAIVVAGALRGFFWAGSLPVFNLSDEAQHYHYVESLAKWEGPPEVGRDNLSRDTLSLFKASPTWPFWRSYPVQPDPSDPRWEASGKSYEGFQGPLYYALLVVPYWLARPFGLLSSVFVLRAATVLVSLAAVPVAYLLGRRLFPDRPGVWLGTPAVLVMLQGFNANLATIGNDALVVPLAAAALLPVARAIRDGLTTGQAACSGLLFGLCLLTKSTTLVVGVLVGMAVIGLAVRRRSSPRCLVRWMAVFLLVSSLTVGPWVVWNVVTYGQVSASEQVDLITGPLQPRYPFSGWGVKEHLRTAASGFWDRQTTITKRDDRVTVLMFAFFATVVGAGLLVALRRRRRQEAALLLWLSASFPLVFLVQLAVIYLVFDGTSSVVGRHAYAALVPMVMALVAGSLIALGVRLTALVLLAVLAASSLFEVGALRRYLDATYATGVLAGGLTPVDEQAWSDAWVAGRVTRFMPSCPAVAVSLAVTGPAPPRLEGDVNGDRLAATFYADDKGQPLDWRYAVYRLDRPRREPFSLDVPPGTSLGASGSDRSPRFSFEAGTGDPVARIYCHRDDAKSFRFSAVFAEKRPRWITYRLLLAWPMAWAVLAAVLALVATLAARLAGERRAIGA